MSSEIQIRRDLKENGSFVEASNMSVELNIPDIATLDASYRLGKVVADNG